VTDLEALLAAIRDNPEDDTPRLVYADEIEDRGEGARAEFIRAAVACDRLPDDDPRKRDAWAAVYEAQRPHKRWWSWYGPGDRVLVHRWERGFVAELATDAATWLEAGDQVWGEHPTLRRVTLTTMPDLDVAEDYPGRFTGYRLVGRSAVVTSLDAVRVGSLAKAALEAEWERIAFTLPPPARTHQYSHWQQAAQGTWRLSIHRPHPRFSPHPEFEPPVEVRLRGVVPLGTEPQPGQLIGPIDATADGGGTARVPRAVVLEVMARFDMGVADVEARVTGEYSVTPDWHAPAPPASLFVTLEPRA
jgi:uncharacterized protein (TIGR02996 family)